MNSSTQIITPSHAKQLLENNTNNRPVRKSKVTDYANQMKLGLWKLSPEGITISKTGKVLNGQHRLHAVILANINVPFLVFTEVDDELFKVFDTGANRSPSDVFSIEGIKNATTIPSIITLYNHLMNKKIKKQSPNERLSNTQILEYYHKDSEFWDMIGKKSRVYYDGCQQLISPSIIGACYAIFIKINENDCEKFFQELCLGVDLKKGSITQQLRNKFLSDAVSQKKLPGHIKVALIFKAWNAMRENKKLLVLKFDHIREDIPELI